MNWYEGCGLMRYMKILKNLNFERSLLMDILNFSNVDNVNDCAVHCDSLVSND